MSSKITLEKDFLFVLEIKNEAYYKNQSLLAEFLKVLPDTIRIYAVIPSGMNMLKVYCITKNWTDYEKVSECTGAPTVVIDSRNIPQNQASGYN